MTLRTYHTDIDSQAELQAAAAAEGVPVDQAAKIIRTIPPVDMEGMKAWISNWNNDGADDETWRATWPVLATLNKAKTQVVMRYVAAIVPDPVAIDV